MLARSRAWARMDSCRATLLRASSTSLIRRSSEKFIQHNRNKYGLPLAIWVACEVWDFGCMSVLFSGLPEPEQNDIAKSYGLPADSGSVMVSWLRSLNYVRNACAHHSRLWN